MTRFLTALAVLGVVAACAQPRQPTGGPPVERPPQVVDVTPAPFSVVQPTDRPVVIRFDERLSERLDGVRDIRDAVLVSPETGEVRVRRGRREIRVSLAGGWQPGLVYRVEVLPVIRGLFNNQRDEPVELVFSTGPEIPETAVAGLVEDRLTGRAVGGARIEARNAETDLAYLTVTDTAGFFALRHIPAGSYDIRAWLDRNRDRMVDFGEPQDSATLTLAVQDTAVLEMALLPRDTTPARLARATPLDSTKIELAFDDYFDAASGRVPGSARVYRQEDSTLVAEGTLFHRTQLDSLRAAERQAAEAAADTTQAQDVPPEASIPDAIPPGAERRRTGPPGQPPRSAREPARALPARELVVLLPEPLQHETRYFVVVEGVTNIQGVAGGGGTAPFRTAAPPAEPTPDAAPDPSPDAPPDDEIPPEPMPRERPPPGAGGSGAPSARHR
jgi:hypothetical protein